MNRLVHCLFNGLLLAGLVLVTKSCSSKCQNGPTPVQFKLLDPAGKTRLATSKAGDLKLAYYKGGQLTNMEIGDRPPAFEIFEPVEIARRSNDTTRFYLTLNQQRVGVLQLKTYIDNSRCDGWPHVNEVLFNGQPSVYNKTDFAYLLVIL